MKLREIVNFFCNVQTTGSKEEAFLKGVLFGYGVHLACPMPNWKLLKKNPELFADIEREMREIFEAIHKRNIDEARKLLDELKRR